MVRSEKSERFRSVRFWSEGSLGFVSQWKTNRGRVRCHRDCDGKGE
jgi:hypothetical protein